MAIRRIMTVGGGEMPAPSWRDRVRPSRGSGPGERGQGGGIRVHESSFRLLGAGRGSGARRVWIFEQLQHDEQRRRRSGGTVDIYSSLPLLGASTAQTKPMVNGIKLALDQAHNKAGNFDVKYTSLNDATAQAGEWDAGQCAKDARKAASRPQRPLLHRRVQLGRQRGLDPDPQPGRDPAGEPANTYVGLTTDEPGSARASRTSTTRPATGPTCGSSRATPSRPPPTSRR